MKELEKLKERIARLESRKKALEHRARKDEIRRRNHLLIVLSADIFAGMSRPEQLARIAANLTVDPELKELVEKFRAKVAARLFPSGD